MKVKDIYRSERGDGQYTGRLAGVAIRVDGIRSSWRCLPDPIIRTQRRPSVPFSGAEGPLAPCRDERVAPTKQTEKIFVAVDGVVAMCRSSSQRCDSALTALLMMLVE